MTIKEFSGQLRLVVSKAGSRPFVCEGSPLECSTFIVGLNPATQGEFWPYWSDEEGFDKARWFADYKTARRAKRKTTGKKSPEVSPTRRIINKVVEGASPTHCLEINLFAMPTESIAELSEAARSTAPIELLLRAITPKVLLFHGSGRSHLRYIGIPDPPDENEFRPSSTPFGPMYVGVVRHFSRGWSYKEAEELGLKLHDYSTR